MKSPPKGKRCSPNVPAILLAISGTARSSVSMDLVNRYPAIRDLKKRAKARIPFFMWEYLDSGTGDEVGTNRNRAGLDQVLLKASVLKGKVEAELITEFLGQTYDFPFGIAPLGMSGAIWPRSEGMLAELAAARNIPYTMSTMATKTPEDIAHRFAENGWFQLYPPGDMDVLDDMLARIKGAGFRTLVLTVDVPAQSRRERQVRSGLTNPVSLTPRTLAHVATRPAWAWATMKEGLPGMPFITKYSKEKEKGPLPSNAHIGYLLRVPPDWDYLARLREKWSGKLIVKGVLDPDDATRCQKSGADAVWISNHAARQFDALPAAITAVAPIRQAVGPDYPLLYDSGVMGGLDILRAIASGADFVMLGKAFHYGTASLGEKGANHVVDLLQADMIANMGQMGLSRPTEAREQLA